MAFWQWLFDGLGSSVLVLLFGSLAIPWLIQRSITVRSAKVILAELAFNVRLLEENIREDPPGPRGPVDPECLWVNRKFLTQSFSAFRLNIADLVNPGEFIVLSDIYDELNLYNTLHSLYVRREGILEQLRTLKRLQRQLEEGIKPWLCRVLHV